MKTNTIITIGRQYGSGGKEIGHFVAEAFGIKLYDKEMLACSKKKVVSVRNYLRLMTKSQRTVFYILL